MKCEMRNQVLAYLKGEDGVDAQNVEAHIESCAECAALVEGYMEKEQELKGGAEGCCAGGGDRKQRLKLEPERFKVEDSRLKEQVAHYEKGTRRIVIFTLVGFLMGWFSILYYTDSFLVTKVILAVPYKLGEMIHNIFHQADYRTYWGTEFLPWANEFFPGDRLSTFLAERIVPVLFGGAIYGSLAYFTGDKRIFTLKRYLKFAAAWAVIILGFTGITFGINAWNEKRVDAMEGISEFMFYSERSGSRYGEDIIIEAFYQDGMPERCEPAGQDWEKEIPLGLGTGLFETEVSINCEDRYMVTKKGTAYRISEQFAAYVQEYYETGTVAAVEEERRDAAESGAEE